MQLQVAINPFMAIAQTESNCNCKSDQKKSLVVRDFVFQKGRTGSFTVLAAAFLVLLVRFAVSSFDSLVSSAPSFTLA